MANGINTKFDPERIAQVAETMFLHQNKLSAALDTITQRADLLKQYWQSDAADTYQTKAGVYKKNGDELSATLLSLAKRLQEISGIQRKAEKDTTAKAEELPIDGVK